MERENLIQLISKELKLDEKIVSRAIEIIENTQRKTGDDIYFANQVASNMEISEILKRKKQEYGNIPKICSRNSNEIY